MNRPLITVRSMLPLLLLVATVWLAVRIWSVLVLIAISFVFAAALLPWVDWLVAHHIRRGLAVALTALLLLAGAALVVLVVAPVLVAQVQNLADQAPDLRDRAVAALRARGLKDAADQLAELRPSDLVRPGTLAGAGRRAFGIVSTVVTIVVLTAYLLLDAHRIKQFVLYLTPEPYHGHVDYLESELQHVVGGYVRGQVTTSLCIGVFTFVLLSILGVPNALALGILAAIADVVPIIGVFLLVVPTAAAALPVSLTAAIIVAAAMTAYTWFENNVLVQWVYGRTLDLPASAILVGLLVGGALLGVAGALLSLPGAATTAVLIRYFKDARAGRIPPAPNAAPSAGSDRR